MPTKLIFHYFHHVIHLHRTNFLTEMIYSHNFAINIMFTDERLHATSVWNSLISLRHCRNRCEFSNHFVMSKSALYSRCRLSRSNSAILSFQQLNLLIQKILWQLVTTEWEIKIAICTLKLSHYQQFTYELFWRFLFISSGLFRMMEPFLMSDWCWGVLEPSWNSTGGGV